MRRYIAEERAPDPRCTSDAELLAFARATGTTVFHPTSTCRMGSDSTAVVDERLRVHGIERLRVVDGSIMPTLVSGNTNAAIVMIAEKGADMILQDVLRKDRSRFRREPGQTVAAIEALNGHIGGEPATTALRGETGIGE